MMEFGVLGGQRFVVCAVCHGVIALPEWQHVAREQCQGQAVDVLQQRNESVAKKQQIGSFLTG